MSWLTAFLPQPTLPPSLPPQPQPPPAPPAPPPPHPVFQSSVSPSIVTIPGTLTGQRFPQAGDRLGHILGAGRTRIPIRFTIGTRDLKLAILLKQPRAISSMPVAVASKTLMRSQARPTRSPTAPMEQPATRMDWWAGCPSFITCGCSKVQRRPSLPHAGPWQWGRCAWWPCRAASRFGVRAAVRVIDGIT